jgi:hypothetical protein
VHGFTGPESTSREQARVQVLDVCEDGGHNGNKCFLRWECKEPNIVGKVINYTKQVFGFPRPNFLEWVEDVRVECLKAGCRLIAGVAFDRGMVQFG